MLFNTISVCHTQFPYCYVFFSLTLDLYDLLRHSSWHHVHRLYLIHIGIENDFSTLLSCVEIQISRKKNGLMHPIVYNSYVGISLQRFRFFLFANQLWRLKFHTHSTLHSYHSEFIPKSHFTITRTLIRSFSMFVLNNASLNRFVRHETKNVRFYHLPLKMVDNKRANWKKRCIHLQNNTPNN